MNYDYSATYSPDDNKLRLRAVSRLPKDLYERVRGAGFIWAPKQDLFVAPAWTPSREDLLLELCGEVGDEGGSMMQRAEHRADRFDAYSEHRAHEADQAHKAVAAIADNIPLGQPILVGHHSERHARKDAERIENGMRRAVQAWKTSQYWTERAQAAIAHACYLERPDVRARRIKTIEAERRKIVRQSDDAGAGLRFWRGEVLPITEDNKARIHELLGGILGQTAGRFVVVNTAEGTNWDAWNVLAPDGERCRACPPCTVEQCRERAEQAFSARIAYCNRWISHYDNRLSYEREMLASGGGLAGERFDYQAGGRVNLMSYGWKIILRVNKRAGAVQSLRVSEIGWRSIGLEEVIDYTAPSAEDSARVAKAVGLAPLCNYPGEGFLHQTKAEYEKTVPQWSDFPKIGRRSASGARGAHRVRQTRKPGGSAWDTVSVYITDLKRIDPPAVVAPANPAPCPTPLAETH